MSQLSCRQFIKNTCSFYRGRSCRYQPCQIDGNWDWDIVRGEFYGIFSPSGFLGASNFVNSNGCKNDLTKNSIPMGGANPSFTISAFAERNIENIIANDFV